MKEIESDIVNAIEQFHGAIRDDQLEDMRSLALAGEYGVAFENLCTQLFEFDVVVSCEQAKLLKKLGSAMEIDAEYWEQLTVAKNG